ncbi:MAG TPA: zinc-dependent metalloprotease [Solirubrobacteraceae bacterium]|nr:zinc-dependent metalloprotease [Solirubrobacteraceae bacterium]
MGVRPAIDWGTAQRVGELVAGSPPYGGVLARSVQPLAHDFARRVGEYTGLQLPPELPPLETLDRPGWIAANLKTMRPLLDSLTESAAGESQSPTGASESEGSTGGFENQSPTGGSESEGPTGGFEIRGLAGAAESRLTGSLHSAAGHMLGAQLGGVTGLLSQRVLGQYDISLLDPAAAPRLLLLAPNLAAAARNLGVDRDELTAWVAIHEITHAVQFSGAPWLREHLGGMLRELLAGLQVSLANGGSERDHESSRRQATDSPRAGTGSRPQGGARLPDPRELLSRARSGELRDLLERARRGELLRLTLGEDRWLLVERMQATMSLIEGHAEHTMDAVGAEFLPSLPRLRSAMNRRRESYRRSASGLPWRVLERLLGLELKLRQYEIGRRFCDAVVESAGAQTLAIAWSSPAELPTTAELATPALWLERIQVPA